MNKLFAIFCALLVIGRASAQPPAGAPGGMPPRSAALASGHLYGKIVDSTGHGIGQASVLILKVSKDPASGKRKEILLKGITTQNNGDFSAEDLPINSTLKLTTSAI